LDVDVGMGMGVVRWVDGSGYKCVGMLSFLTAYLSRGQRVGA